MKVTFIKKIIACVLALLSVLNLTPFSMNSVAAWLVGPKFINSTSREKADMILDLYMDFGIIYQSDENEGLTRDVISEFLVEIFSGDGDGNAVVAALDNIPVFEPGERDPERDSFEPDSPENLRIKQALISLVDVSKLPEEYRWIFVNFTGGMNDFYVYFLTTKYDGIYEFAFDCVKDNGDILASTLNIYYDKSTHMIYNLNGNGIASLGFDCDAGQLTMTNPTEPWQRKYGFNIFFDIFGNILIIDTDTVRVKFNYDGKDKMIQFWKGNYTKISNGAEIGVYNRQENSRILYDSVPNEEMLYMSMELYHGDKLIFQKERQLHWWLTGYNPGPLIDSGELTLISEIEFTDSEMLNAFAAAAKDAFGERAVITLSDLTAHIIWK